MTFSPLEERIDILQSSADRFGELIGSSSPLREVYGMLERIAPTDVTVLLEGETGTGKELAARAVHSHSRRSGGPFVVIDCGAVAPNLIESELFGHEKGAFTDAVKARQGAFELADGGTIFLDEIGELSLDLQPSSCAPWTSARPSAWAPTNLSRSTSGSSPPRTRSWRRK